MFWKSDSELNEYRCLTDIIDFLLNDTLYSCDKFNYFLLCAVKDSYLTSVSLLGSVSDVLIATDKPNNQKNQKLSLDSLATASVDADVVYITYMLLGCFHPLLFLIFVAAAFVLCRPICQPESHQCSKKVTELHV